MKFQSKIGMSVLEFCIILCVIFPVLFGILGVMDYYRMQYILDDIVENEFGNRDDFIVKIGIDDLKILPNEEEKIKAVLDERINDLNEKLNYAKDNFNNDCVFQVKGNIERKENIETNNEVFFLVNPQTGAREIVPEYLVVRIEASLNRASCSKVGSGILSVLPNTIISSRELLVDSKF